MCTAATYQTKNFYMGRTLDYEFSYGDEVTITPRNYPFHFRHAGTLSSHYAMIGMAHVAPDNGVDYPLYYDACNEKGVCMAGLNFVGNAAYADIIDTKENVAQFEFIPWILSQCASVSEAREKLVQMNLVGTVFASHFPAAQLHWMIADKSENIVVESMADGLHIYDNPAGVLTNNPPFPMQMFALNNYAALSSRQPENHFSDQTQLTGLQPRYGGFRSAGRFIFPIPFYPGCFHQTTFHFRQFRNRKCQPVLSYLRFRRPAAGLL